MATLPQVGSAAYPTPDEIRDSLLRAVKNAGDRRGITLNILPGSDLHIRFEALAKRLSIAVANNKLALDALNPLTATGDDIKSLASVFGMIPRPAASAAGFVTIKVAKGATVVIPKGHPLTSADGQQYKTDAMYTVADANSDGVGDADVGIVAVGTGAGTDQKDGATFTWASASLANLLPTCTAKGAVDGGADEDSDEMLRERLLDRISSAAVGGNWAHVKSIAESASSSVEAAYVYSAARGPGSIDVAVTKAGGDRTLAASIVNTVAAKLVGELPGHVSINVTSVTPDDVDVWLLLDLPKTVSAGGVGGGWRDATPWPPKDSFAQGASTDDGKVTAYNSATGVATVRVTTAPVVGQHVGVWDSAGQKMYEYTITEVGGSAGARTIKVEGGFSVSPLDAHVSTGAVNLAAYATSFRKAVEALGPGEKTTSQDILPRGARRPTPDAKAPFSLSSIQLGALMTAHPEILSVTYGARHKAGTTTTLTAPSVPAATADPPKILRIKNIALRKE